MSTMSLIILGVVALWVLFSGGTPVIKFILYRALFVAFAVMAAVAVSQVLALHGLGLAVLAVFAAVLVWSMMIGPLVSGILNFRKNPTRAYNN